VLRAFAKAHKVLGVAGFAATFLSFIAAPCFAQKPPSAGQITPETLRPQEGPGGAGVALPGSAPLQSPAGAANLTVRIRSVQFEGGFPELADTTALLTKAVTGQRITVAQLYAYAYAIEQAYAAAGYVLVRVVVPPQHLVDGGTFHLVIVDGYIEAVDVSRLSERVRGPVSDRVGAIVGQRHLKLEQIERKVLLAGEVPGLRLRSTLAKGREQGGTLLVLEGDHNVVQGALSSNNFLSDAYGRWQFAGSAALNSALGFGEQVYGSYSGSDELGSTLDGTSPLRVAGGGVVIPLGSDGLTLNPEYTFSRTRPLDEIGVLRTEDQFERIAVRLAYPIELSRARSIRVQGIYEHIDATTEATDFDVDLNHDRYSVARVSLDNAAVTDLGWPVLLSATYSRGLGGRSPDDALASGVPLSRIGADPEFSKLVVEARLAVGLPQEFRVSLSGRAQTSFGDALLESEQFSLDSPDVLSGFDSGTLVVDKGLAGRVELSRAFVLTDSDWANIVTPYVFGAAGRGSLEEPTALEQRSVVATSYGVGVRANVAAPDSAPGASINFEAARHHSDDPDVPDEYRGSFSAGINF